MADDINPALRAELQDALTKLAPQIRGLHDLRAVSISQDLANSVDAQIHTREHRRDLINAALAQLDLAWNAMKTLEADGYPAMPNAGLIDAQFTELKQQESDWSSGIAVFDPQASRMTIGLGAPMKKPTPPTGEP